MEKQPASTTVSPASAKCCYFIPLSLRTQCIILGYMNLVYNTITSLWGLMMVITIGILTNGFVEVPETEIESEPFLFQIVVLLFIVLCVNVVWLVVNVACLVCIHKRRPGPIRVYVSVATAHLVFSVAEFMYISYAASTTMQNFLSHSINMGLTVYFIVVYYTYGTQQQKWPAPLQDNILGPDVKSTDIGFLYTSKSDKKILIA